MRNHSHLLFTALFFTIYIHAYVPIVLVHGVMGDQYSMAPTEHFIKKYMGEDVYIKNIKLCAGKFSSTLNVYHQVKCFKREVQNDPKLKNGFNLIAHSQGGLVSRFYMQRYNDPQVLTYISWGSPQQGVYGLPGTYDVKFTWLNYLENYTHYILYSKFCQSIIGFAGYWHDTLHYDKYLDKCTFLPFCNNHIDHKHFELFKENVCKLKNMVLVMSTEDDIIEPRISCHFGFYKPGSKTVVQTVFETDLYKKDLLGLKTLHETGRLHLHIAHCTHVNFQEDESNFVENTLEYLKADPNEAPHTAPGARLMQARAQ